MQEIVALISSPRLDIYKDFFSCVSDEEALGIYLWNQKVNSEFNSIIQIIEIALRNAIINAYEEREGKELRDNWLSEFFKKMPDYNISRISIEKIEQNLGNRSKGFDKNDVVSGLSFGFWTDICSNQHSDTQKTTPSLKLWPSLSKKIFSSIGDTNINYVFDLVGKINVMRNRVSHHEVLWKDLSSLGYDAIFNTISKKYHQCLELAFFLNEKNLKLVKVIDGVENIKKLCRKEEIEKYKNILLDWDRIDGIDLDLFKSETIKSLRVEGSIVKKKGSDVFITSEKHRNKKKGKIFFEPHRNEVIKLIMVNERDKVSFIPSVYRFKNGRKKYLATEINVLK